MYTVDVHVVSLHVLNLDLVKGIKVIQGKFHLKNLKGSNYMYD